MPLTNALLPLIRPLQITSLNPFSISSLECTISKRFNLWSVLSIILLVLFTSHGVVYSGFYINSHTLVGRTILFIKLCAVRLGHITILVESLVQRKKLMEMINILSLIDLILVKKLGVDVNHKDLRKLIIKCIVVVFVIFIFIESLVLIIILNYSPVTFIVFWFARLFSYSITCLRYFQIIIFIYIIQSRLSIINLNLTIMDTETSKESKRKHVSTIGLLKEDNQNVLNIQQKQFKDFDKLTILRELFGKLWEVSNLINSCFGFSLLVCTGNDFLTVTLNGYWMYVSYKQSKNVAIIWSTAIWSIPHLLCLIFIAGFCYFTVSRANETALICHKIRNRPSDGSQISLDSCIEQFSLQLLHQKPSFNACGFFIIDFTLIYAIIGAITTYLVILIQFQMSS